jgi:glycosyltransferase involved in cell wall biosynthesis
MAVVGVYRTIKFVKYLREFGWEPIILTLSNPSDYAFNPELFKDIPRDVKVYRSHMIAPLETWEKWRAKDNAGHVAVAIQESVLRPIGERERNASRPGLLSRIKRNIFAGLSTPDKCTGWALTALPKTLSIVRKEKVDCLYTSTPPHSAHLIGLWAKKFTGRPFVADFRAPWTQNEYFDDVKTLPWQKRLEERMELAVQKSAEIVISNSTWEGDGYRRKYGSLVGGDKFYPILNGYDPDDFDPTGAIEYDKFTIVYIGSLYKRRSPELFLEGLRKFLDANPEARGRTKALFIGPGDGVLRAYASQYGVNNHIESIEFLPQHEAYKYLYGAHVLLMILGFDSRGKGVIPAKIFEYLPTGRPVLALIPEGETAEMMRKYNAGTIITSPDVDQVVRGIETSYQAYRQNPRVIPGVKVIEEYTRRHQTGQLAELLDRAVAKKSAQKP